MMWLCIMYLTSYDVARRHVSVRPCAEDSGGATGGIGGVNTGAAAERVRRQAAQRVVDLIDIVAVCRAERIKLLAELVTASRISPARRTLQP